MLILPFRQIKVDDVGCLWEPNNFDMIMDQSCPTLVLLRVWTEISVMGDCPEYCRMLSSSILGFYPLVLVAFSLPVVLIRSVSNHCQMSCGGKSFPQLRITVLDLCIYTVTSILVRIITLLDRNDYEGKNHHIQKNLGL